MFLHLSVILFIGWMSAPLHAGIHPREDPPPPGRHILLGKHPPPDTTGYGQQAGSAHPTGMHTF